jgi:hypothetical protein
MFVRYRNTANRLQLSLVECHRVDGRPRLAHIASLGSVPAAPTVADRVRFWTALHERLGRLDNRVPDAAKVYDAVHARVPMPTPDEQAAAERERQLENAQADAHWWGTLRDMNADTVEQHKALAAQVADKIAKGETAVAGADTHVAQAQERVERIERGEQVEGGLGKPMTREDYEAILFEAGWTKRDLRRLYRSRDIDAEIGPEGFDSIVLPAIKRQVVQAADGDQIINKVWRALRDGALLDDEPEQETVDDAADLGVTK